MPVSILCLGSQQQRGKNVKFYPNFFRSPLKFCWFLMIPLNFHRFFPNFVPQKPSLSKVVLKLFIPVTKCHLINCFCTICHKPKSYSFLSPYVLKICCKNSKSVLSLMLKQEILNKLAFNFCESCTTWVETWCKLLFPKCGRPADQCWFLNDMSSGHWYMLKYIWKYLT